MATTKKTFLQKVGLFFLGIWNAAKAAFKGLTPEQQEALKQASGITSIIQSMIKQGAVGSTIRAKILERFPQLDLVKLNDALVAVAQAFNIKVIKSDVIEDVIDFIIGEVGKHLNLFTGGLWASQMHNTAGLIAVMLSPAETKFAKFAMVLEYVYQHYIKGWLSKDNDGDQQPGDEDDNDDEILDNNEGQE